MKQKTRKKTYVEWLSAEDLHNNSMSWLSKLRFSKDEQRFLDNLIKDYTLDLLDSKVFNEVKPTVNSLKDIEEEEEALEEMETIEDEVEELLKKVELHENQLQIMVDNIDQLKMEDAYIATHFELSVEVQAYDKKYEAIKAEIFRIISSVMKKRKQDRLLKP